MPYRNERQALEDRRAELAQRLTHLAEESARAASLQQEAEGLRRDLEAVTVRLAEYEARQARSTLEDVRVAAPCGVPWESMVGDERVRHCGVCQKNVFNLSAMTRDAAEQLLAASEGAMCVRLYKRADGTVITADCPEGQRKRRRRLAILSVGAGALAAAATATMALSSAAGSQPPTLAHHRAAPQGTLTQGDVAPLHEVQAEPPPEMEQGQRLAPPAPVQRTETQAVHGRRVVHGAHGARTPAPPVSPE